MNDQLRNDQPSKFEPGVGSTSRAPTAAVSSTNDHLEEVLKGQAQQAEFLQHIWMQQSQMQHALQQQVCALMGAIQQLAETQQAASAWTSEEKTQQRKEFKRNKRHHSSQVDLIEIFSPPRIILHAVRQGLRTTTPTNLDLTEDWDATTVTGRDRLEDILKRQKPWMTTLKLPCAAFLEYVSAQ